MQINKHLDIHITLGNENDLQFLTKVKTTITSNENLVKNFKEESKIKQSIGEDGIFALHFFVEQGRQKQALAYFQDALKQDRDQSNLSPIQLIIERPPQSKGTVQIIQNPGCIIVKYLFYNDAVFQDNGFPSFDQQFGKYQKATLNSSVELKGFIRHNNKNRTNIKVDYVDLEFESDQMTPKDLFNMIHYFGANQQQLDFLAHLPALQMLANLKRAQFQMKLASFRQIKGYYNKACGQKFNKQDKPFPYINRGIFRQKICFYGFMKGKVAVKSQGSYNGQDVLMRLVKVFVSFIHNL